jgi:hypothetical protein
MEKSIKEVSQWLIENELTSYVELFQKHSINGEVLLKITEKDLIKILGVKNLGDLKKFEKKINELREDTPLYRDSTVANNAETYSESIGKLLLSFVYLFVAIFSTSITMTVVHSRLPDSRTYPPLPDFFLDNVPFLPWAFSLCEIIICFWMASFGLLVLIHKYRGVIIRRFNCLCATLFLLRCVTMFVTSLSVPGEHLQRGCSDLRINRYDRDRILQHSWEITKGTT